MEFTLSQETNLEQERINAITAFSQELKNYFSDKNYGADIEKVVIGLICVKPEFELFFKARKPTYVSKKTETHGSVFVEIRKSYSYDLQLDFEKFSRIPLEKIPKAIAAHILQSLSHFHSLPNKVKDFNADLFESDAVRFFKEHSST